jgi:Zn-dependent metalloprotease
LLRLDDPDDELTLQRSDGDELGRRHLRFAQQRSGLPVWPAELIVHLDAQGNVDAMDGAFVPTPRVLAAAPAIGAREAVAAARAAVPDGAAAAVSVPALIIYAPGDHPPRLVAVTRASTVMLTTTLDQSAWTAAPLRVRMSNPLAWS